MNKIKIKFDKFVNILLFILISLSFIGAVVYLPIQIYNTNIYLKIFYISIFTMVLVSIYHRNILFNKMHSVFEWIIRNRRIVAIILFICIVMYQLFLIFRVNLFPKWDVETIYTSLVLMLKKNIEIERYSNYFSVYPNNRFILFALYNIAKISKHLFGEFVYSRHFFQLLNVFVLDISIIVAAVSIKRLFNEFFAYIFLCLSLVLTLSVYIFFPYTDTMVLPIIAFVLYQYSLKNSFIKYILIGVLTASAYLMKPSSVVYIIAVGIFFIFNLSKIIKNKEYKHLGYALLLVIAMLSTIKMFGLYMKNQNILTFDSEKEMPPQHFIAMGLQNAGRYSHRDVIESSSIDTKKERAEYNTKKIFFRLKEMNYIGYIPYVLDKHIKTTKSGDFEPYFENNGVMFDIEENSWIKPKNQEDYNRINQDFFKSLYFSNGANRDFISINSQIIWIFTLMGILLSLRSVKNDSLDISLLKLILLGAFSYLMIFESGRSRYLIQFIFYFDILSIYGYYTFFKSKKVL